VAVVDQVLEQGAVAARAADQLVQHHRQTLVLPQLTQAAAAVVLLLLLLDLLALLEL
jgi:hypothetical protein